VRGVKDGHFQKFSDLNILKVKEPLSRIEINRTDNKKSTDYSLDLCSGQW
jgi:hypothetical protein